MSDPLSAMQQASRPASSSIVSPQSVKLPFAADPLSQLTVAESKNPASKRQPNMPTVMESNATAITTLDPLRTPQKNVPTSAATLSTPGFVTPGPKTSQQPAQPQSQPRPQQAQSQQQPLAQQELVEEPSGEHSSEVMSAFALSEAVLLSVAPATQQPALRHELFRLFKGPLPVPKAQTFDPASVSQDLQGMQELVQRQCWRAVILLGETVVRNQTEDLQVYSCLIAGHLHMGDTTKALALFAALGPLRNLPQAPFALYLQYADLCVKQGQAREAQDWLLGLLAAFPVEHAVEVTSQIDTYLKLASLLQVSKQNTTALNLLVAFSQSLGKFEDAKSHSTRAGLIKLWVAIGRQYAFIGDVQTAKAYFTHVQNTLEGPLNVRDTPTFVADTVTVLNQVLLDIADSAFETAYNSLAALLNNRNILLTDTGGDVKEGQTTTEQQSSGQDMVVLLNNFAVCCLYTNRVSQAISTLESLVQRDPIKYLCAAVSTNLAVLYRLSTSKHMAKQHMLTALAYLYGSDDLPLIVGDFTTPAADGKKLAPRAAARTPQQTPRAIA